MSEEKIYLGKQCEEYYKKYNLVSAVHKIIDLEEVLNKIKKYIKEKDLTNNMYFMDDGIGNLFKDILELLEEIE